MAPIVAASGMVADWQLAATHPGHSRFAAVVMPAQAGIHDFDGMLVEYRRELRQGVGYPVSSVHHRP